MKNNFQPVDALVDQVKGNTNFLQKVLFSRNTIIAAGILSAVFLIASLANV